MVSPATSPRAVKRPFSPRNPRPLLLLLSFLLALLVTGCAGGPDAPGDDTSDLRPAPPPAPELAPPSRREPLRYPRLLDDPVDSAPRAPAAQDATGLPDPATRAAVPPRTAPRTDPLIEDLLDSLTLRQRIGQRFIAPIPGSRITYGAGRAIVEVAPAGFIFYPWNFQTAADVRQLAGSIAELTGMVTPGIGPLLCADQEGGRVATFRFPESVRLPAAHHLGRLGPESVEAAAYLTALQMRELGLNMNLAPVLDAYGTPDSSIIGDRSYSGDPHAVAGIVGPYLRGSRAGGVISVAKHFPGHGSTTVDSHSRLPVVDTSLAALQARDLVPFSAAIESGVEVIMTAHILFESIDPFYPVTLSRVFLTSILREQMGFTGVVMSDGLEMGAIRDNYDLTQTLIRLFRHDVDLILLFSSYDVVDLVDRVEDLIRVGEITEDDVNRGVRRVLRLKIQNGLAGPVTQ